MLYWHWSPTHGWAMDHAIRGWNECLITYVLAAASPRHAIDPTVYHPGFASGPGFRNGKSWYGIELPLGMPYGGPLFFAHYSFCGLDPRGLDGSIRGLLAAERAPRRASTARIASRIPADSTATAKRAGDSPRATILTGTPPTLPTTTTARSARLPRSRACRTRAPTRHGRAPAFPRAVREAALARARLRRRVLREPRLVRRHLSRDRSGADRPDDREPPDGAAVEAVHVGARSAGRASPPRLLEPALGSRRGGDGDARAMARSRAPARRRPRCCRCVSARDIVKVRPGFGQTVRPIAGSVVASRVLAAYDPDPDYFFHWFRDSAIVIDAVRLLYETGHLGAEALTHFADFVRFSLSLGELDGRALATSTHWRENVTPDFVQYLRGEELAGGLGRRRLRGHPRESRRHARRAALEPPAARRPARCARSPCCAGYERSRAGTPRGRRARRRSPTPSACCASTSRSPRPAGASRRSTFGRTSSATTTSRCASRPRRCGSARSGFGTPASVEGATALRDGRARAARLARSLLASRHGLLPIAYHAARRRLRPGCSTPR